MSHFVGFTINKVADKSYYPAPGTKKPSHAVLQITYISSEIKLQNMLAHGTVSTDI